MRVAVVIKPVSGGVGVAEGVALGVGLGDEIGVEVGDDVGVGAGGEEGREIGEVKGVTSAAVFGVATLVVALSSPPDSIIEHPKHPTDRPSNNAHKNGLVSFGFFISGA